MYFDIEKDRLEWQRKIQKKEYEFEKIIEELKCSHMKSIEEICKKIKGEDFIIPSIYAEPHLFPVCSVTYHKVYFNILTNEYLSDNRMIMYLEFPKTNIINIFISDNIIDPDIMNKIFNILKQLEDELKDIIDNNLKIKYHCYIYYDIISRKILEVRKEYGN